MASRRIVVSYSIPLADDFAEMVRVTGSYAVIHEEIRGKLEPLGVALGDPRIEVSEGKPTKGKRGPKPKLAVVAA